MTLMAKAFMLDCIEQVREALRSAVISADGWRFFRHIITALETYGVEYTASMPLNFRGIKRHRSGENTVDEQCDYFELRWKPKSA